MWTWVTGIMIDILLWLFHRFVSNWNSWWHSDIILCVHESGNISVYRKCHNFISKEIEWLINRTPQLSWNWFFPAERAILISETDDWNVTSLEFALRGEFLKSDGNRRPRRQQFQSNNTFNLATMQRHAPAFQIPLSIPASSTHRVVAAFGIAFRIIRIRRIPRGNARSRATLINARTVPIFVTLLDRW